MNLDKIKEKLNSFKKPEKTETQKEKIDFTKYYWKPGNETKTHVVRIVPSAFDKDNPFREVYFHYNMTKAPILALSNFGEKDPVTELIDILKKDKNEDTKDDNRNLAKKLYPKLRILVPVIVRGEEEMGVRLWEFGKEIYQELLAIADDEEIGDFTDPVNGRDLKISRTSPKDAGNTYGSTSVRITMKQTPLSKDSKQVKDWLENQPDIFSLYKRYDYNSLKEVLGNYLTSPQPDEQEVPNTQTSKTPSNTQKSQEQEIEEMFAKK